MDYNIVLIGMPGSGKSTVGRLLAKKMNAVFVDLDTAIEQKAGKTIPQIFAEDGEPAFRDMEQLCAEETAARSGQVIATGGGIILREANMTALGKKGVVVFLNRPIGDILRENLSGRPLLKDDATRIHRLYDQRIGLYRRYGQITVENTTTPRETVKKILDAVRRTRP